MFTVSKAKTHPSVFSLSPTNPTATCSSVSFVHSITTLALYKEICPFYPTVCNCKQNGEEGSFAFPLTSKVKGSSCKLQ